MLTHIDGVKLDGTDNEGESQLAATHGSVASFYFVTDPNNEIFRFLILPTVQKMKLADCRRLTVELRGTKILFEALP